MLTRAVKIANSRHRAEEALSADNLAQVHALGQLQGLHNHAG